MPFDFAKILSEDRIADLKGSDKTAVLDELVALMATSGNVRDQKELREKILEREKTHTTGFDIGVAVPHVKIPSVSDFTMAVGRSFHGVDFAVENGKPVHLIVMVAANDTQAGEYLKLMARLVVRLRDKEFRREVMLAKSPEEVRALFLAGLP